jgi:iron complex outermembrane receptor protein
MKKYSCLALLPALVLAVSAFAETHTAEEMATWRKPADNKIHAQKLLNEVLAAHPELVVIGLHATAPGTTEERMIATNLDRVGKLDDDDDKAAVIDHKIILAPNPADPTKFEVQISLKDSAGNVLPAGAGLVFKYKAGDDPVQILTKAVKIRDEFAKKTPNFASLFTPVEKL